MNDSNRADSASATLFNIQRFSIHDGPGVRTVVFFKGCSLCCVWCHNPESISPKPELLYYPERCICCGKCARECPSGAHVMADGLHIFHRELCESRLACASSCYAEALAVSGQRVGIGELLSQILDEKPYYAERGGVTFSGGESMLQIDFLEGIIAACAREGVHCAVDTAGHVPWASFERLLPYEPMFLYDIKAADPDVHKSLTGADNRLILANLRRLGESGARLWIRIPYVPGYNDDEMEGIAGILADIGAARFERVDVMGYHRLGEGKYAALGRADMISPDTPSRDTMESVRLTFALRGIVAVI